MEEVIWMKKCISVLLCSLLLLLGGPVIPAETETDVPVTETVQETQTEKEPSKAGRIVQFLVIFTAAAGVTVWIVMRPKMKLLKEAREQTRNEQQYDHSSD